jgi:hypothetical protein
MAKASKADDRMAWLREQREADAKQGRLGPRVYSYSEVDRKLAKAVTKVPVTKSPVTKVDVTKLKADVTKVGRPKLGKQAMTAAERKRRQRASRSDREDG